MSNSGKALVFVVRLMPTYSFYPADAGLSFIISYCSANADLWLFNFALICCTRAVQALPFCGDRKEAKSIRGPANGSPKTPYGKQGTAQPQTAVSIPCLPNGKGVKPLLKPLAQGFSSVTHEKCYQNCRFTYKKPPVNFLTGGYLLILIQYDNFFAINMLY